MEIISLIVGIIQLFQKRINKLFKSIHPFFSPDIVCKVFQPLGIPVKELYIYNNGDNEVIIRYVTIPTDKYRYTLNDVIVGKSRKSILLKVDIDFNQCVVGYGKLLPLRKRVDVIVKKSPILIK